MYDILDMTSFMNNNPYFNPVEEQEDDEMPNLYTLAAQYEQLRSMVDEEADTQMILDTMEGIEGDISDKVENIVKLMRSIESDEEAIKAEEERLYNRRKGFQNRRESLKKYLEDNLTSIGMDKVKTAIFTVSMQNNAPSVKLAFENPTDYPESYRKVKYDLDKKQMAADLKDGKVIDGAQLVTTRSLRVR